MDYQRALKLDTIRGRARFVMRTFLGNDIGGDAMTMTIDQLVLGSIGAKRGVKVLRAMLVEMAAQSIAMADSLKPEEIDALRRDRALRDEANYWSGWSVKHRQERQDRKAVLFNPPNTEKKS